MNDSLTELNEITSLKVVKRAYVFWASLRRVAIRRRGRVIGTRRSSGDDSGDFGAGFSLSWGSTGGEASEGFGVSLAEGSEVGAVASFCAWAWYPKTQKETLRWSLD